MEEFPKTSKRISSYIFASLLIVVILSMSGLIYNYWNEQNTRAKEDMQQTLIHTKKILEIQDKLNQNGEIWSEVLKKTNANTHKIAEDLAAHRLFITNSHKELHKEMEQVLNTQKDATTEIISQHQQVSRTMFMEEFAAIRAELEKIIAAQIAAAVKDLVNQEYFNEKIMEVIKTLKEKK